MTFPSISITVMVNVIWKYILVNAVCKNKNPNPWPSCMLLLRRSLTSACHFQASISDEVKITSVQPVELYPTLDTTFGETS